ncbi:pseudouridine synthase [Cognatishimia activa]|uniref:Pseudouridine synthase n=1 Tax=Cognatishimia activa TaxID=1715691 RepID=A0A0P1IT42_9RHOB|nr:pseudouridine synthase [Cognatishimia activa]CUI77240.1 Ribosomal large subunit pseudouridine synthase B [Cognatishimia activa]CUK26771.1 Ribosomal large subunit pseudouridine synthase B [Cognatishimia activa]
MTHDPSKKTPAGDRIAKVLSRAGIASRRDAERMIEAGRVAVNGQVLTSPALNVRERDLIEVDGKRIAEKEPERIWLYHKPVGLVTTHKDEKDRSTIFDALPDTMPKHVMTVGRLDLNSEGLLLLTNDGEVKRKLELPATGWVRKYKVRVNGRPTEETFTPLRRGITVDGERFAPMTISLDRQQGANAWLTVSLKEGKNREIRRAMAAIELTVNRLIRVAYGPFQLGDLKPGEVDELRRRVVRDQLGLDGAVPPEERKKPQRRRKPSGQPGSGPAGKPGSRVGKPGAKSGKPGAAKPAFRGKSAEKPGGKKPNAPRKFTPKRKP